MSCFDRNGCKPQMFSMCICKTDEYKQDNIRYTQYGTKKGQKPRTKSN